MAVAVYERYPVPPGAIEHPWRRDIVTGVASMTTTGGHLWNAAERLAGVVRLRTCSSLLVLDHCRPCQHPEVALDVQTTWKLRPA